MKDAAHESFAEHSPVAAPSDRKFGLTLGPLFLVFAGARWILGHIGPVTILMAAAGAVLLTIGATAPAMLAPLNRAWMKLGAVMAAIVNPVVMFAMFALVFTPVAIAMRLGGRDALALRRRPASQSYWAEVHSRSEAPAERLRQQF